MIIDFRTAPTNYQLPLLIILSYASFFDVQEGVECTDQAFATKNSNCYILLSVKERVMFLQTLEDCSIFPHFVLSKEQGFL